MENFLLFDRKKLVIFLLHTVMKHENFVVILRKITKKAFRHKFWSVLVKLPFLKILF